MAWWALALAVVAGAAVVAAPGAAIALGLRLRGLWFAGAVPLAGVSAVTLSTFFAGWAGTPLQGWAPLTVGVVGGVICALLTRVAGRLRPTQAQTPPLVPLVAVALGCVLMLVRSVLVIESPGLFAQVGDNVFHLNAARFIFEGGDPSPLGFGTFGEPGGSPIAFYPTTWHSVVALIAQLSGASIPVASNAALIIFGALIWPLAGVLLTRTLFGSSPALLISAGVLSAGFAAFPFQLIPYMGTYPLVGSIPLVAIGLAAIIETTRLARAPIGSGSGLLILLIGIPGIGAMHPSAVVMLAVLALAPVTISLVRVAREHKPQRLRAVSGIVIAVAVVLGFALLIRPDYAQEHSWRGTIAQSIGEVLLQSWGGVAISLAVAILLAVGLVRAVRHEDYRGYAAATGWLIVGLVYVAAAGTDEFLRILVAGPWYSDATRVAAFAPIVTLPLAALGGKTAWRWMASAAGDRTPRGPFARATASILAIGLFVVLVVVSPAVRTTDAWTRSVFTPTDNPMISRAAVGPDERAVLDEVVNVVPESDVIAGNQRDGSNFAFAITGRRVLMPHVLSGMTPLKQAFYDGFATASPGDAACTATRELGVKWILQFHPDQLLPTVERYRGLEGLDDSANVELAYRKGDSSLYRVVGCDVAASTEDADALIDAGRPSDDH
ncbi:DUF6541 family protein [Microbacterium sp. NPDC056044]|uniref:DUF6541 family protein n=1 Tax=Microbacterium sp. NPDC056044 TaxID=3345690 RepID=UPI0035D6489B